MHTSGKYLIHAEIRANGVVERSDVVGAIFGQTEGLLGDELDLRDLQDASKIGRIDVQIDSEEGRSFGTITISSGLDRVETAVLSASLETIERVGPCRAECTVTSIEDARTAKRRELVDRATELLRELEDETVTSEQIVQEVRQQTRVAEITEFEGLPAGPRVADSDAIIVVEGRSDVKQLLRYGIKNAIAVEGTDVPAVIADVSQVRNTTAFLDGDRGGDLILRELAQVGDVDYVAFAPSDASVEDLDRATILAALRKKVPYDHVAENESLCEPNAPQDSPETAQSTTEESTADDSVESAVKEVVEAMDTIPSDASGTKDEDTAPESRTGPSVGDTDPDGPQATGTPESPEESVKAESESEDATLDDNEVGSEKSENDEGENERTPGTLAGHVKAVIGEQTGTVRLLDETFEVMTDVDVKSAFDAIAEADTVPETVVLDGEVSQRILDVAAQRGVGQVVGASTGEFVKQPASVRVRTASELEIEHQH
jgi:DNA primase